MEQTTAEMPPFSVHPPRHGRNAPIVVMGVDSRQRDVFKGTVQNIRDTEEFVINLVNEEMAEKMNICAVEYPSDVNELAMAGLNSVASRQVSVRQISVDTSECLRQCYDVSSAEFTRRIKTETENWRQVIERAGIKG